MVRKLTLSLTILLLLCGVSYADFIYTTENGTLGALRISSSNEIEQSTEYYSNISYPLLTAYWNSSTTGIMLLDRYATDSGDRAYIFSPSNLTEYSRSADIPGVYGANFAGYAESGYSIFLASGPTIYDVDTSSFNVRNSFDCTEVISQDSYDTEIYGLTVDSSYIHVLAKAGDSTNYIRLEGQLKREGVRAFISRDVSPDTYLVISSSSNRAAVCHSSGIDLMDRSGRFQRVLSTDYPVKAICTDNSGEFFYAEQIQNGSTYTNTIYHSARNSSFIPITIESSSPNIKLIRDNSRNEFFAAMTDEQIMVIMYSSGTTSTWEYSASTLGGKPFGITTASVSGYNAHSSSSGCSTFGALILFALIPLMMRRK